MGRLAWGTQCERESRLGCLARGTQSEWESKLGRLARGLSVRGRVG